MPTKVSTLPSKSVLITELKTAYEKKGSTPTSVEAERRMYGLHSKRTFILVFGSWNEGVRQAGLPVNEWKRGAPQKATRRRGPIMSKHTDMESFIENRLQERKERAARIEMEVRLLEEELQTYRRSSQRQRRVS